MKHASPDSVARFICDAALGKIKGVKIDTIGLAVLQAYENYRDSDLVKFSETFDTYGKAQPLPDKMKLLMLSGQNDPQGLGYQLGLEYVGDLREKKMTVEQAVKEVEALRKACGDDTATFVRFLKGFQTVLRIDHGKDLSEELYQKFINYQ